MSDCVFCDIVEGITDTRITFEWDGVIAFEPLNPVAPGHMLIVPERHVPDAAVEPWLTAQVMFYAALIAQDVEPANIITSIGWQASQTVMHLHVHVVPRRLADGLALPWTTGGFRP